MKKIFSLLAAVLFAGSMMATDPITINATDITGIESGATTNLSATVQGIQIAWEGAYYNPDAQGSIDIRVYANKSVTLTASENISKVEIVGYCKAGLAVTANAGTVTTGASYAAETTKSTFEDPLIVVENIDAASVTLNCTKQMRAYSIRLTFAGGETPAEEANVVYNWSNVAASQVGATILGAAGVEVANVKIHTNTDEVPGIKFGSSYVYADGKWIAIKPANGGFKAGDKLSVAAVFNNADDTKYAQVDVYAADGATRMFRSDSASTINGRTSAADPIVQTYTLASDQDSLFLGRYGNTGMFVTLLNVVRGGETPVVEPDTIPTAAPAAPKQAEADVMGIYCNHYTTNNANFAISGWAGAYQVLDLNGTNVGYWKDMTWECIIDPAHTDSAHNFSSFANLHVDMWAPAAAKIKFTAEAAAGGNYKDGKVVELAKGWNSFDFALAEWTGNYDFSNLKCFVFEQYQTPAGESFEHNPFAFANIYFWNAPTMVDPTNCAEAAAAALSVSANNELYNNGKVYTIEGYVTEIATAFSEQYKNITFWMADTKDGGKVLEAFRAVCDTVINAPIVGDKVKVTGSLTKYNTTPEFAAGCTFVITEHGTPVEPQNLGEKTIAEFLELKNKVDTCILTGVVLNIKKNDDGSYNKYGNFDLADATDTVYVYGLLTASEVPGDGRRRR